MKWVVRRTFWTILWKTATKEDGPRDWVRWKPDRTTVGSTRTTTAKGSLVSRLSWCSPVITPIWARIWWWSQVWSWYSLMASSKYVSWMYLDFPIFWSSSFHSPTVFRQYPPVIVYFCRTSVNSFGNNSHHNRHTCFFGHLSVDILNWFNLLDITTKFLFYSQVIHYLIFNSSSNL